MATWAVIENFPAFVRELTERYREEDIAGAPGVRAVGISVDDLERWRRGGNHYLPRHEEALYGFCVTHQEIDLIRQYRLPLPAYDVSAINKREQSSFDLLSSRFVEAASTVDLIDRPTSLAGHRVNFPFGVAACNASIVQTANSEIIAFYAALGFDILTYKTVRTAKVAPHPDPNWVSLDPRAGDIFTPPFDQVVIGDLHYAPDDPTHAAMANSFGNPSREPAFWQPDVAKAKQALHPGQLLIVSVVATVHDGDTREEALIDDFVTVAKLAKEAGADVVEANYSCPNVPGDPTGTLYQHPALAGRISAALRSALGTTPLFVKIGYLDRDGLTAFVRANSHHVQGIVGINTIPLRVNSLSGYPLFPGPGRERAGISGAPIRRWAQEVAHNLVEIRAQMRAENDFVIVGVGGVCDPHDVCDYLNLGVDAVQSCTAAHFNRRLAQQVRHRPQRHLTQRLNNDSGHDGGEDMFPEVETGRGVMPMSPERERPSASPTNSGDTASSTLRTSREAFRRRSEGRASAALDVFYQNHPDLQGANDSDFENLSRSRKLLRERFQRRAEESLVDFYRRNPWLKDD